MASAVVMSIQLSQHSGECSYEEEACSCVAESSLASIKASVFDQEGAQAFEEASELEHHSISSQLEAYRYGASQVQGEQLAWLVISSCLQLISFQAQAFTWPVTLVIDAPAWPYLLQPSFFAARPLVFQP